MSGRNSKQWVSLCTGGASAKLCSQNKPPHSRLSLPLFSQPSWLIHCELLKCPNAWEKSLVDFYRSWIDHANQFFISHDAQKRIEQKEDYLFLKSRLSKTKFAAWIKTSKGLSPPSRKIQKFFFYSQFLGTQDRWQSMFWLKNQVLLFCRQKPLNFAAPPPHLHTHTESYRIAWLMAHKIQDACVCVCLKPLPNHCFPTRKTISCRWE